MFNGFLRICHDALQNGCERWITQKIFCIRVVHEFHICLHHVIDIVALLRLLSFHLFDVLNKLGVIWIIFESLFVSVDSSI